MRLLNTQIQRFGKLIHYYNVKHKPRRLSLTTGLMVLINLFDNNNLLGILLTEAESLYDVTVTVDVALLEVGEQTATLTHELGQ